MIRGNSTSILLLLATFFSTPAFAQISGTVTDQADNPVAGATVKVRASSIETVTDASGQFILPTATGSGLTVVAALKGFFNGGVTVDAPNSNVNIVLELVPQDDDPNYFFMSPFQCAVCHVDQFDQWYPSRMGNTGLNTWVYDLYNGTGSPGGSGGFVYTRDSAHAVANPGGWCASCHQPEHWIDQPGAPLEDINSPTEAAMRGVSCDVCHKIADVDMTQVNATGFIPGSVTVTRPDSSGLVQQVMYGALGDVDFNETVMRASYQPQMVAQNCAVCHEYNNDPDHDGDFEETGSTPAQQTFSEWENSPYGDETSPHYQTCVDCHMPSWTPDLTDLCAVFFPPQPRVGDSLHSHDIQGTSPQFLENAVSLTLDVAQEGFELVIDVSITNDQAGHAVPTGITFRNMILLVEAVTAGGVPLTQLTGSTLHPLAGVGDPEEGYYSGLPGKLYANVLDGPLGEGVIFTDSTGTSFDNRISPFATDITTYRFQLPAGVEMGDFRARLIYRRMWRAVIDDKGWEFDGQGNLLADIQPPFFGHPMESAVGSISVVMPASEFIRGDCNSDGGTDVADAIAILAYLFAGSTVVTCEDACDVSDDGALDIADAIYSLSFQFSGGPQPAFPYPLCGTDPTADGLICAFSAACSP